MTNRLPTQLYFPQIHYMAGSEYCARKWKLLCKDLTFTSLNTWRTQCKRTGGISWKIKYQNFLYVTGRRAVIKPSGTLVITFGCVSRLSVWEHKTILATLYLTWYFATSLKCIDKFKFWLESENIRPVARRQHRGFIIPQAVIHSLMLLKIGKIIALNVLSWLELLIRRYCCI